jgi:DNA-binding NarL/FixJ family response regulator
MNNAASAPIKLFIVDDHAMIRFAMESWVERSATASEIVVVGTAENGTDALRLVPASGANFLLIDFQLPDMEGTDVIKALRSAGFSSMELPILLMTGMEAAPIKEILASGANGYLSKQESSDVFLRTIQQIHADPLHVAMNPEVAKHLLNAERALSEAGITAAEKNVLKLIRLTNEEIGELLGISKGTVKNHIANIFQKLNVTERDDAVKFAVKVGLIPRSARL